MTGGELLRQGTTFLRQAGFDQPRLEAEVLLAHAWNRPREELLIHPELEAPETVTRRFQALIGQRAEHVPAAYLTGAREFMSLMMAVTPAVLIPRSETELLVDEVLHWLASRPPGTAPARDNGAVFDQLLVADVGTGSGAIAVSLARYHLAVQVMATDISEAALDVAAVNANRHGLADRITFFAGDLLTPLLEIEGPGTGAAVVANLPYIPTVALEQLPPEVQREPRLALDGGGDGLDLYRRLLPQAVFWLAPGGLLACEIGPGQVDLLFGMLDTAKWQEISVIRDYRDEERVVTALRTGGEA